MSPWCSPNVEINKAFSCEKLFFSKSFYNWKIIIGKFPQWSVYHFQHYFHRTHWRPFHNQIHIIISASYHSAASPSVLPLKYCHYITPNSILHFLGYAFMYLQLCPLPLHKAQIISLINLHDWFQNLVAFLAVLWISFKLMSENSNICLVCCKCCQNF